MKIEAGLLHFDAADKRDARLIRTGRRGYAVRLFAGKEIEPLAEQVESKLFWAGRTAMTLSWHEEERQLNLLEPDRAQPAFNPEEAGELARLIVDGLLYPSGVTEERSFLRSLFSSEPPKFVDSVWSYGLDLYRPHAVERVIPEIQAFADQALALG